MNVPARPLATTLLAVTAVLAFTFAPAGQASAAGGRALPGAAAAGILPALPGVTATRMRAVFDTGFQGTCSGACHAVGVLQWVVAGK